jgi:tetratricopeptide (TPR) repeat protein
MNKKCLACTLIVAVFAGVLSAASESDKSKAYYHYLSGALKENKRQYNEAIDQYREALKFDPDSSEIFSRLAYLYVQTNRIAEAVEDAQKAIEKDPDNKDAHRMLGQIYIEKVYLKESGPEDLAKAVKQFEEVYRIDSEDESNMLTLGQLYVQNKQPQKAVDILKKYVQINPDSPAAVMTIANAYQQMNQTSDALTYMMKYLETKPDNLYVAQQAAELLEKSGDFAKALEIQKKIYESDSENPLAIRRYVELLEKNRLYPEAVTVLQERTEQDPDRLEWKVMLAKAYQKSGEQEQAEALMKTVIERDASFDYQLALVQIYEDGGRYADAKTRLEQMLNQVNAGDLVEERERQGSLVLLYSHLGYVAQQSKEHERAIDYYKKARLLVQPEEARRIDIYIALNLRNLKKWDEAIEVLNGVVNENANDSDAWELLSLIYEDKGDPENSDKIIKHLMDTHPDNLNYRLLRAERLQQRQQFQESLEVLKDVQPKFPENDQLLFMLGAASERLKRFDEAEEYFKKSIHANPENANALNYLGYMLIDRGVRIEESIEYIKRALEIDRDNGAFLDSLGWGYFKLNQLDLAEDNLRMALDRLDENAVVHDHLGDLYFKQGKFREAVEHWENALKSKSVEIDAAYIQKKINDTKARQQ